MNRTVGFALVALGALSASNAASAATACVGKVAFSDTFDKLNSWWGDADKNQSVKDGRLTVTDSDGNFYATYADPLHRNVDFCADVVLNAGTDLTQSYGGIVFWMRDLDHFYTLQITLDGYADVYQYDDGDWKEIVGDREFTAVKKGVGAVNELRVLTHAGEATFYVNGQKFDTVTEKGAPGTSHIGFMIDTPSKGSATFAFDNAVVHEVPFQ